LISLTGNTFPTKKSNSDKKSSSVINCVGNAMAGHYLPELAEQIVLYNEKPGLDSKINFKGFAVHNHFSQCDGK
jgi:hypothetical protein